MGSSLDIVEIGQACTGCGLCMNICPQNCITMVENEEGFRYPYIDKEKCIHCGKCFQLCPQNNELSNFSISAHGAIWKDTKKLKNSTSGGVATALSEKIILDGGVVFGAIMQADFSVVHIKVDSLQELSRLQGSKYVQSNIENIFNQIRELLKLGTKVLFIGTPCQVAAINLYIINEKEKENLFLIDLICHGVPSPKLFKENIKHLEKKHGTEILGYDFRSKKNKPWGLYYYYYYKQEYKSASGGTDPYYEAFLHTKTYRESCYQCKYACMERTGDLTIGDFWGVEYEYPKIKTEQGVSAILVNTKKGQQLLNETDTLYTFATELDTIVRYQENLKAPCKRQKQRDEIYRYIKENGYEAYADNFYHSNVYKRAMLKTLFPYSVKMFIKKLKWKMERKHS